MPLDFWGLRLLEPAPPANGLACWGPRVPRPAPAQISTPAEKHGGLQLFCRVGVSICFSRNLSKKGRHLKGHAFAWFQTPKPSLLPRRADGSSSNPAGSER